MRAVSFRGDGAYLDALKALAAAKGTTVGDMVFEAIKAAYDDELKPHLDFFRAKRGQQNDHSGESTDQHSHTAEDWARANPTTPDSASTTGAKNG